MKKIILTLSLLLVTSYAFAIESPSMQPDIAFDRLKKGNDRFVAYQMKHPNTDKARRDKLVVGQHPFAVVLTCSDSRVAPEIIFDQGLGDIFVIRNAGNVLDEHVMGSIEYAVEHLGVNLIIVLGHESCGAVGAAMKEEIASPAIESIKTSIKPAIEKCKKDNCYTYDNVIKANVKLNVNNILENEEIKEYSKKHDIRVMPAYYNLVTGKVEFLKEF